MDLNELREHERYLIKWFINDIGDDEKVTSEDLDGYCDVLSNAENYQNKIIDCIYKAIIKFLQKK